MNKVETLSDAMAVILDIFPDALIYRQESEIMILTGAKEGEDGALEPIDKD